MLKKSSDSELQVRTIDELGMEGSQRAVALLIETLTFSEFPLKDRSLILLFNINQPIIYLGLKLALDQTSK